MTVFDFFLFALASFRLTHLIVFDRITEFIRKPFHQTIKFTKDNGTVVSYIEPKGRGLQKFIGSLLTCHWCTGIWSAGCLVGLHLLVPSVTEILVLLLAIAGTASLIELVVQKLEVL